MAGELKRIEKLITAHVGRAVKLITTEVTALLIETTPVDTGWARANWVPSIGEPREAVVGTRPRRGKRSGKARAPAMGAQTSGIARVVTSYKPSMGSVFISNNVHYIPKLNDGHSGQAPSGFVEFAVDVGKARAATKLRKVGK